MIIFSGPSIPKFMADALVVSENVGDGGPGDELRFEPKVRPRRERGRLGAMMDERGKLRSSSASFLNSACHCFSRRT